MHIVFFLLCLGLAGYCALFAAYCFGKRKTYEGVSASVLTLLALGAAAVVLTL